MKIKRITLIITLAILSGCHDNTNTHNKETKANVPNATSHQVARVPVAPPPVAASSPIAHTATSTGKPVGFSQANGAVNLAQKEFDEGNYKLSIVAYYEGFVGHFYPDNVGEAAMFGLNASKQTKRALGAIAKPILTDERYTPFVDQAGVDPLLDTSKALRFTPEDGIAFVGAMTKQFDEPAMKALGPLYARLNKNQQAALFYHSYKTGGFSKYPNLVVALRAYATNPSQANLQTVLSHINYSYKLHGQTIQDTRGAAGIQAMFTSPEAYAAVIGRNPSYIKTHDLGKELPALSKVKINGNQSIDSQIPDPVGIIKEQAFQDNKPIPVGISNLEQTKFELPKPAPIAPQVYKRVKNPFASANCEHDNSCYIN